MAFFRRNEPQHQMSRLDHRGHGPIAKWSRNDADAQKAAQKVFREHQANGFTMYDISDDTGTELKEFDPAVTEILAVPRMKAG